MLREHILPETAKFDLELSKLVLEPVHACHLNELPKLEPAEFTCTQNSTQTLFYFIFVMTS